MDPNHVADVQQSYYFLFFLLPRWEQTGTVCPVCWPQGSNYDSVCLCPRPWEAPPAPGSTISGETAGGN